MPYLVQSQPWCLFTAWVGIRSRPGGIHRGKTLQVNADVQIPYPFTNQFIVLATMLASEGAWSRDRSRMHIRLRRRICYNKGEYLHDCRLCETGHLRSHDKWDGRQSHNFRCPFHGWIGCEKGTYWDIVHDAAAKAHSVDNLLNRHTCLRCRTTNMHKLPVASDRVP